ncbi:MAG: hypothetical protein ACRDQ1_09400 [Sciscionella sp.]
MVDKMESGKDIAQELVQSGAAHAGRIASILSSAVREVTGEVGEWFTDLFEMREAAARARADHAEPERDGRVE